MALPKIYQDGQQITNKQASLIGRDFLRYNADMGADELSAIFRRAVYGEAEAREELLNLLNLEMIG